jgi:hypothetical protein
MNFDRVEGPILVSLTAATLGLCVGWAGPVGLLLWPTLLLPIGVVLWPTTALSALFLEAAITRLAIGAADRMEHRLRCILFGLPLGFVNLSPVFLIWDRNGREDVGTMFLGIPLAYLLGALGAGTALGFAIGTGTEQEIPA